MATILVVDDEIGIRELLSEILSDEGHEILLADNAATARLVYAKQTIDLVLLDIWMPDMDGMSLLREWVNTQVLYCPIVMMSGHASLDTAVEAQHLGAAGFLEKPITLHKLLSTVHKVLTKGTFKKNHSPQHTVTTDSQPSNHLFDANGLPSTDNAIQTVEPLMSTDVVDEMSPYSTVPALPVSDSVSEPLSVWHDALSKIPLDTSLRDFRESVERIYFNYVLHNERWSMTRVAEIAGLERTHLYRKLKQLDIDLPRKSIKLGAK